jgi:NAD(P)-dependent dehydrogenase (short-subunit alcohol dehydrogenase family)
VFLCSRNKDDVDSCVQQLKEKGCQVQGAAIDVSDLAQRRQLVQQVSEAFEGKVNILGKLGFKIAHTQPKP